MYRHISFAWIAFYITYFMYIPINLIAQLKCQQTTDEEEDKFASLSEISKKRDIKLIKRLEHVSLGVESFNLFKCCRQQLLGWISSESQKLVNLQEETTTDQPTGQQQQQQQCHPAPLLSIWQTWLFVDDTASSSPYTLALVWTLTKMSLSSLPKVISLFLSATSVSCALGCSGLPGSALDCF